MKKQITVLVTVLLLCGCSSTAAASTASASSTPVDGDTYTSYKNAVLNVKVPDSYAAAVNSTYKMAYSDNTSQIFTMDGTLEASGISSKNVTAHMTQHISSKGTDSDLNGWYYGGRLYNTYNNVTYYEDMSFSDLKKGMLVPMEATQMQQSTVSSVTKSTEDNGNVSYSVKLNADTAASVFSSRYDSYGFSSYDGYTISDNTILDIFDKDGYLVQEKADFTISVTYNSQPINISFSSYVSYLKMDNTTISITDAQKSEQSAYVNYKNIDTSKITTETLIDDSEESTTEATFKKRLVGRLEYKDNGDGTFSAAFNDSETYTIDFNNKTFKYTNHTIAYSYSWRGDVGSMGSCTYLFNTSASSTDCQDTTVSTIKDVKTYLEMELFYCGLSLEDLQAEAS